MANVAQISFMSDAELKKKALEKAKREGITLKTILCYSMKAYVENKIHFGIVQEEEPEIEEIHFESEEIQQKAEQLAHLLR